MAVECRFCDQPAERVCSWVVAEKAPYHWNGHRYAGTKVLCGVPVCFRHMVEPGEMVYCADHWRFTEKLPPVPNHWARQADADPERFNPRPKRRSARA